MPRQTISRPPQHPDEHNIETVDAERNGRDVPARREARYSRSTSRPQPTRPALMPAPSFAGRPHGHVVGHPVGKALAQPQRETPQTETYEQAA